jgi:hypothetical protein
VQVSLHNVVALAVEVFEVPCQENAAALARCFGLGNECLAAWFALGVLLKLLSEVAVLRRKQPSLRKQFVLVWEPLQHLFEVAREVVFPREGIHAWEVVYSLVGLHLVQPLDSDSRIAPVQVPLLAFILRLVVNQPHLKQLRAYVLHHVVLGLTDVDH